MSKTKNRMNEKRFRRRGALLAFASVLDTIEGMSPGHCRVNLSVVRLFVFLGLFCTVADAREQVSADPTETAPFMVLPFDNASPVAALDWMSSALAVTVAEKLESHPSLRPVYPSGILDGLTPKMDPEAIAQRAHDLGAKWVVGGSFSRPNWKSEMKVRVFTVIDPSDEVPRPTLRQVVEVGSVGERGALMDQIDANLLGVLQKMSWSTDAESIAMIKRRPTKDLYAFTLYGRALNLYFGWGGPRDLVKAEKALKKVCLIDPKFAEAHRVLGRLYLDEGERAKASSQYSYALDLKPGYYAPLFGQARIYRAEGNRARAQELTEKALEVRPYDVDAREMLGELLWEAAELDRALVELEKVTAVQPKNLGARRTLALVYAAKGDTANLADELEKVQDIAPDDLEVKLDLGSAYQRMGANDKAITAYEEVVKRQPKNVQALKMLGDCYRREKEPDKAIAAYQRAKKLAPEDPRPYFLLGAAYEEAGDDARAEVMFQEAQQFRRYLGEAWINLGSIAFRRGDLSKANWYLSRAIVRAPSRPKGHYNYALVLSAKKERDRALDELKIAGDLDPEDAEIRYLAGVILLRQGRLEEAKHEFEEALRRRPDHADARHNLALLEDLERRYGGEHAAAGSK
jgi:Flp pilus assembly protein TadD